MFTIKNTFTLIACISASLFSCNRHNYQAHFPNKGYHVTASVKPAGTNLQQADARKTFKAGTYYLPKTACATNTGIAKRASHNRNMVKLKKEGANLTASVKKQAITKSPATMAQVSKMQTILARPAPKTDAPNDKPKGKSQVLAALLALPVPLGVIGIYNFYLGYKGRGILRLLLFLAVILSALLSPPAGRGVIVSPLIAISGLIGAALVIWSFVEFITILTNDLRPKNGEYSK
ncbi:MAG: NINE protein [Bacteroidota bacterium]